MNELHCTALRYILLHSTVHHILVNIHFKQKQNRSWYILHLVVVRLFVVASLLRVHHFVDRFVASRFAMPVHGSLHAFFDQPLDQIGTDDILTELFLL